MTGRSLSAYVDGFVVARGYAPASAKQRRGTLAHFIRTVGDIPPAELTPAHALDWWASLETRSPYSRRSYLSAVRAFMEHLIALGVIEADPTKLIRKPRQPASAPQTLTKAEVAAVIAATRTTREKAVLALMLGIGLRSVDVVNLRREDIDLTGGTLRVKGKGGRVDVLPIPPAVGAAVDVYLDDVPDPTGAFVRRYDDPTKALRTHELQQNMTRLMRRAGVKRGALDQRSPHVLRRTCATTMLEAGASIRDVQILLRHGSLATTQLYLRRPEAEALRSVAALGAYEQAHELQLSTDLTTAAEEAGTPVVQMDRGEVAP